MATAVSSEQPEELFARVQDLQAELSSSAEARTRELAEELLGAVVQFYGAGLERMLALLASAGEDGERLLRALGEDPHIAALLLIHDLHPQPLEERVRAALTQVRPYMESHGGDVELLSLQEGVARIRLQGSCSDCAASTVTLELAIKQALDETAPDLEGLEVEGLTPPPAGPALPMATPAPGPQGVAGDGAPVPRGVELPIVQAGPPTPPSGRVAPPPAWFELDGLDMLPAGRLAQAEVAGSELLVANVEGTLLAYRDTCPACAGALHGGELHEGALACPGCGRAFFLPRAGRSLDDERIQLEPVPLLREGGHVKVALST